MAIYKTKRSPFYYYEFECHGRRYRGTTGETNRRTARAEAGKIKLRLQQDCATEAIVSGGSLEIWAVVTRYVAAMAPRLAEFRNVKRDLDRICTFFRDVQEAPNKLLSEIADADVTALVRWRREHPRKPAKPECGKVSAGTVNHTVTRLQALFSFAKDGEKNERGDRIKRHFPNEPKWSDHRQVVTHKQARTLDSREDRAIERATRDDYAPFVHFARLSALRFEGCVTLTWSQVRWGEGVIVREGKRLPNGKPKIETVPLTSELRAILEPLKGHHSTHVFTYVAQRTRDGRKKGQRYPITYQGARSAFRRAVEKAGVDDFSFHGLRRTRGTEVLKHGNLAVAQKMLNHRHVTTTMKYLNVTNDDVAEAMSKADRKRRVKVVA